MEEMIGESLIRVSNNPKDKDIINDLCSGLFNLMFCVGNILGPILGNWGYVHFAPYGAEETTEYVAYITVVFGVLYFFLCDDAFYHKKPLETADGEISYLLDKSGEKSNMTNRTLPEIDISSISLKRIKL